MIEDEITEVILQKAFHVHTALGPGLLESAYKECLCYDLRQVGLDVQKEKSMPLFYKEMRLDIGYRIDLLVENKVIIEVKTVDTFHDIHIAQVLTYMQLSDCKLGLLLNFKTTSLKNGIKRLIL
jgi:GxxExxY protein